LPRRGPSLPVSLLFEAGMLVRPQTPSSPTPRCPKRRVPGSRLWRLLGDLAHEVLCFLRPESVCELVRASSILRSAGAVQVSSFWRLVTPHVQLDSRSCADVLEHVWLPQTRWLEARSLNAKASRSLMTSLSLPGPKAVSGLLALDLRYSKVADTLAVVNVARSCRSLRSLDLSRTRLRDEGAKELIKGLLCDPMTGARSPHRELRVLSLEENDLTQAVAPELAELALQVPLEALVLARNQLGDDGAEVLASTALAEDGFGQSRLTRLDLSENRLEVAGLAALLDALGSNTFLRSLDVGGNERIGSALTGSTELMEKVADGLKSASNLCDLHIWRCGLSDAVCLLVVGAQPPQLSLLNIAMNPLSSELRVRLVGCRSGDGFSTSIRL